MRWDTGPVPGPVDRESNAAPGPDGPLRVGVAGAGPWAHLFHAPMVAAHPDTELTAVWARRRAAAQDVAGPHGATAHDSFDRFLDGVDAVAFAVPPDVQVVLATEAVRAGKALLLEKPLSLDLVGAEMLTREVEAAGVPTQMVLTWRYVPGVRALLDAAGSTSPLGGRGHFLTGGLLGGMFATPWRLAHGPLYDLGPHVIDLLDAALGPVMRIRAHGDLHRWVGLLLDHEGGATSEASLTAYSPGGRPGPASRSTPPTGSSRWTPWTSRPRPPPRWSTSSWPPSGPAGRIRSTSTVDSTSSACWPRPPPTSA